MMKLGLFVQGEGHHIAAWRHSSVSKGASQSIEHYANIARAAERGRFDMLFLADSVATFGPDDIEVWKRSTNVSRLEPVTLLSSLASVTDRIGLVSTFSTSFIEPFYVARLFASLDQISHGRAGWNLVTSAAPSEPHNFGRDKHEPPEARYARASEFADVVLGLWNTWEDDAFIEDREAGLFFDERKMHLLNHSGEHFKVRGPLTVRRSPQGHPIVVQAGQSETGRDLAARTADVVFTVQQNMDVSREFRADMDRRLAGYGREPSSLKVMPGVVTFVAETRSEAQERFQELQELIHPDLGIRILSDLLAMDLSAFPLDGPLPDPPVTTGQIGRQRVIVEMAKRENLTLRQVCQRVAGARAHRMIHGSGKDVADDLEAWYRAGAADGFNIMPPTFLGGLEAFVTYVVPELQKRGLFRKDYEGKTLRENLGLRFPAGETAKAGARERSLR